MRNLFTTTILAIENKTNVFKVKYRIETNLHLLISSKFNNDIYAGRNIE